MLEAVSCVIERSGKIKSDKRDKIKEDAGVVRKKSWFRVNWVKRRIVGAGGALDIGGGGWGRN